MRRTGLPCRAMTMIELAAVLVLIALLTTIVGVSVTLFTRQTQDTQAKAALDDVMSAQWQHVSTTGAFTDDAEALDVVSDTQVTLQSSNQPTVVSVAVVDSTLRLAVRSSTGTCFARYYPDPLVDTAPIESELPGECNAVGVSGP